jgi:hypothetical protein
LAQLRVGLAVRSEAYRTAQAAYTAAYSNEAAAQVVSGSIHLDLARRDIARKVSLGRTGDVSVADVDKATHDARVAEADVTSQLSHLAYLRVREAAVGQGLFLDAGANDVSYSTQLSTKSTSAWPTPTAPSPPTKPRQLGGNPGRRPRHHRGCPHRDAAVRK